MDGERWRAEQRRLREALATAARFGGLAHEQIALAEPMASIVVVGSSHRELLERCLRQLLDQDYPNYEVLLVADEDVARQVLRNASAEDIVKGAGTSAAGSSHARNHGMHHARGEIVAFIDAIGFAHATWLSH